MSRTFSEEVKEELVRAPFGTKDEIRAELLGFIKSRGDFDLKRRQLIFSLHSFAASRRLLNLLKHLSVPVLEIVVERTHNIKKRFIKVVSEYSESFMMVDPFSDVALFASFLRGLFLSGGSMTDPRYHYHLEINLFEKGVLESTKEHLKKYFNIKAGILELQNAHKLYIKSIKDIGVFLEIIGVQRKLQEIERVVTERKVISDVNRTVNFIEANAVRTAESTARQIKAIELVKKRIGLDKLPEDLRKVALARLRNKELSLRELGKRLNLTKSQLYSKLKRIIKMAERFGDVK
ncbi:DNA-binding protein WhiA [Thermotoga sp. KOL6]|uniref:DNA-binding protein WhiA n=1 Tax=Thermotoga sp. KOL6 TaxID=126741 RepID=UPI000C792FC7|nr:DNA-binding protein WhiA [Thermotoga sp. KOL6]PLV60093.1 sporulation regulator WhiA [Thermotoga sp. KOL6]